jgi:hypothetical protein
MNYSEIKFKIEESKKDNQYPTFYALFEGNQRLYFHSRIKPSAEKSLIAKLTPQINILISIGFGLGYQWQKHWIPAQLEKIFVFSEDFSLISSHLDLLEKILQKKGSKHKNLSRDIDYFIFQSEPIGTASSAGQIYIFDFNELAKCLSFILEIVGKTDFICQNFPPFEKCLDQAGLTIPDLKNEIKKINSRILTAKNTKEHFAFTWHKNILQNLQQLSFSQKAFRMLVEIKPFNFEQNVFIAGASANLTKTLLHEPLRKFIHGNCLVIATDTAEGILNHFDIKPSISLSSDASYFSLNQMAKWTKEFKTNRMTPLRLGNLVIPRRMYQKGSFVSLFRFHPLEQLFLQYLDLSCWQGSGSHIGATALEIALELKPRRILVAGMDLSYENAITYGHATPYTDFFLRIGNRRMPLSQAIMDQLRRMKAHPHKGSVLYRRATLDRALEELKAWLMENDQERKIEFIELPHMIAEELAVLNHGASSVEVVNGNCTQMNDNEKEKQVAQSIKIGQVPWERVNDFLKDLPAMVQDPAINQALFGHWKSEDNASRYKMIHLQKIIAETKN